MESMRQSPLVELFEPEGNALVVDDRVRARRNGGRNLHVKRYRTEIQFSALNQWLKPLVRKRMWNLQILIGPLEAC